MAGLKSLTKDGGELYPAPVLEKHSANRFNSIAYMINENSIQFNVVSKHLGCDRMSHYLNEAANDMRDLMLPTVVDKAKL